jgi:hypothetical protein
MEHCAAPEHGSPLGSASKAHPSVGLLWTQTPPGVGAHALTDWREEGQRFGVAPFSVPPSPVGSTFPPQAAEATATIATHETTRRTSPLLTVARGFTAAVTTSQTSAAPHALSFQLPCARERRAVLPPRSRGQRARHGRDRGRACPEATDYSDANWLNATVDVAAGAFRGAYDAALRAEEFARFRNQLRPLYDTLAGRATFDTMECCLGIQVEGDGKGHFHAKCFAVDVPATGNRLTFTLDFDQTELPAIVRELDAVCAAFPVVCAPAVPK